LEDAVSGSIKDRTAGAHMLLAQLLDNLRAGSCFIADDSVSNSTFKWLDHFWRKAIWIGWQRSVQNHAGHFPVSCRAIFASGRLGHAPIRSQSMLYWRGARNRRNIAQTDAPQVRKFQAANSLSAVFQ